MTQENNWFETARLGMFVHWSHSSQCGYEVSWPLVGGVFSLPYCQDVPVADYHRTAQTFNPTEYNPQTWAHLAKRLGMQYVILTAKHHDGFPYFIPSNPTFLSSMRRTKKILSENLWRRCGRRVCELGCIFP
jgi:alpha-L-fucosidase